MNANRTEHQDRLAAQRAGSTPPRRHACASAADQRIAETPDCVHRLCARDTSGHHAFYFIHVERRREAAFLAALKAPGTVDLTDFGTVLACHYGQQPSAEVVQQLSQRFGWSEAMVRGDHHGT